MTARAAFVTGGTRGIGFAIACQLAEQGHAVTVCGATAEGVQACENAIVENDLEIDAVRIDVCDDSALSQGIDEAAARHGGLDVLVTCAGGPLRGNALKISLADWDRCLALNLRAPFAAAKAALPHLIRRGGGSIVMVSSIWAVTATTDRVAYTAAKTGLTGLMRALAVDHAKNDVRVNCVAPGYVETDLLRSSLTFASPEVHLTESLDRIRATHPLGRILKPSDVAETVAFLVGESAKNITGQTLFIDGGVTIRFAMPT